MAMGQAEVWTHTSFGRFDYKREKEKVRQPLRIPLDGDKENVKFLFLMKKKLAMRKTECLAWR